MTSDVTSLLDKYFSGASLQIIRTHGQLVAGLALEICERLGLPEEQRRFIEEASVVHDIGACQVSAPEIGLNGVHPYILHGVLGREILEREGFELHALVCERHIGVGLTVADIVGQSLPLPHRDMTPQSLPEEIICFADLFFSKRPEKMTKRKDVASVRQGLKKFGEQKVQIFDKWCRTFLP